MPDPRIEDRFLDWLYEHEDEGRHIPPENLCIDSPELVQPLRARIEA
jgi:hypothetical protein